ncbi:sugar ABC transporter ATP-binding protein [Nonomuraea soli]|uniref:Ribose transport system ATP-binding protein n=1 Tax=Nonomuraea soli TaxID=1032476 RepID=A0A7W0CF77_9ACTN|nr:sugar ABC transporter ATP-binding protein [Nonomuraea soli]MBA2890082.1 ribose transport system ATP-binding protein [Nonomuraea soli]
MIEVSGLRKAYPGVVALDGVSLQIRPHEVVGLAGENGAGKSTLLKALVGLVRPDSGTIRIRGREVRLRGVAQAATEGIGMVFQEQSLVPNLTAAENILLGCEGSAVRLGLYRWRRLRELAQAQLDKIGSRVDPMARTETLSFAERQMVEIAKVLAIEERTRAQPVVLLDEPTSVLEAEEIETLFGQIERLRKHASVVFVSHRLDEVLQVSDRVYVLRGGQVAGEVDPATAGAAGLHRMMIGAEATGSHYHDDLHRPPERSSVRLSVRGLCGEGFTDISFDLIRGEVVAVAGVHGSGREELCRALFGARAVTAGQVLIDGEAVSLTGPRRAVRAGLGYVPSERKVEGVVSAMSVADNMTLPYTRPQDVEEWIGRLRIKTPDRRTPIGSLSGGNQQKVVLARWLLTGSLRVLLLDHPTRGLDVGAKSEVYRLIRELAAAGVAVLLLADSLEECIALSDRVLVMKEGRVTVTLDTPPGAKPDPVDVVKEMV